MSLANGKTRLERMELAYGSKSFKFTLNPQNIHYEYPQRQSVLKTQSGIVIEDFNSAPQKMSLEGTTGGPRLKGKDKIDELRNFLYNYTNRKVNYGNRPKESMIFFNHTEDFAWNVTVSDYDITADAEQPLMFKYHIEFYVIGVAGKGTPGKPEHNEVTSWLYDKNYYKGNRGPSLRAGHSYAYTQPEVRDGKASSSVLHASSAGTSRAKKIIGAN